MVRVLLVVCRECPPDVVAALDRDLGSLAALPQRQPVRDMLRAAQTGGSAPAGTWSTQPRSGGACVEAVRWAARRLPDGLRWSFVNAARSVEQRMSKADRQVAALLAQVVEDPTRGFRAT